MTNIAEILKDCPKGTKLYSPICGECELLEITHRYAFAIRVKAVKSKRIFIFSADGRFMDDGNEGECLLFPSKENRDWSTFNHIKKFKKGDFLKDSIGNIFICNEVERMPLTYIGNSFCVLYSDGNCAISDWLWRGTAIYYANEDEKQKLITAINEKGYIWDAEKLELRKKEPEFKLFDKVLVRDDFPDEVWKLAQYAFEDKRTEYFKYNTVGGNRWECCIPYEGNEHLLGTTENCE